MRQKVLIIDDDKGDIQLLRELFKLSGADYQILWAENGMDGLEIAQKEEPEIVLLDIRMPTFDGHAICQKLKDLGGKVIHVILMTGSLDAAAEAKAKSCGADGFCLKLPEPIFFQMIRFS